jgi:hypothetical protein
VTRRTEIAAEPTPALPPLYKFLSPDNRSPYQGAAWPTPTENPDGTWTPGDWVEVEGDLQACVNGLHLASAKQIAQWWAERMFVAETDGEVINAPDKYVARRVRLVREVKDWPELYRMTRCWPSQTEPKLTAEQIDDVRRQFQALLPAKYQPMLESQMAYQDAESDAFVAHERAKAAVQIRRWTNRLRQLENKPPLKTKVSPYARAHRTRKELETVRSLLRFRPFNTMVDLRAGAKLLQHSVTGAFYFSHNGGGISRADAARQELLDELAPRKPWDVPEDVIETLAALDYYTGEVRSNTCSPFELDSNQRTLVSQPIKTRRTE